MPKVSVIIPVYGVEKYIERCARSLFEQTLDDIEYIFVDDCTPDRSIEILKSVLNEYPHRIPQTRILRMERNSGQGAVRKRGMLAATGDYMIHCDSDDWVEPDIYEKLLSTALSTNADITVCNFWEEYTNHKTLHRDYKSNNPHDIIKFAATAMIHFSLWNRLIRSKLIKDNGIYPYDDINYCEDFAICMRVYYFANQIAYVDEPLYHYNNFNDNSITKNLSPQVLNQLVSAIFRLKIFFAKEKELLQAMEKKQVFAGLKYIESKPYNFSKMRMLCNANSESIFSQTQFGIIFRICAWLASKHIELPYRIMKRIAR